MSVKVYFDFTCPYSYDLRKFVDVADLGLDIEWRCFLNAQAHERRLNWRAFDHVDERPPGLGALAAYYFLRTTNDPNAHLFHRTMLAERHERGMSLPDPDGIAKIAADIGIDAARLEDAMNDPRVIGDLAAEHEDAVMAYGMFGTPTIVGSDHQSMYARLGAPPEDKKAAQRVLKSVVEIVLAEPYIIELRRT